jgi:uncharacterized membrane protein YfcA
MSLVTALVIVTIGLAIGVISGMIGIGGEP